jgi:hypothetical protein
LCFDATHTITAEERSPICLINLTILKFMLLVEKESGSQAF